ncbi:MAG: phosphoribosyl-ATP diphosphatase [Anaerolineales bacterium]
MRIAELYQIIKDRQNNPTEKSYTASLIDQGIGRVAQKVGEESSEVMVAALMESDQRLIEEIADLTYHVLVLMALREITPQDIQSELERRRR